jgi:hypothetical protein
MPRVDLDLFKPKTKRFDGIYRGVVENNNDPEKLGRCKIRIWGLHTDEINEDEVQGIPTENLPWSEPCLGLIEGSVSGAGCFSVPLQGSHVFLFFEGGNWESPRYFATVPGQPVEAPDTSKGFNDPAGEYPRTDRLGEPDWHRLARGESAGTIVDHKNANVDKNVEIALTNPRETWDEPDSAYAAQYPKNIVMTTHRGITIEIDNTTGAERVHVFHPSNTYIEIDAVGNVVFRNEGDKFEITKGDKNTHNLANENETIDIDKNKFIKKDENIEVGNNRTTLVVNDEVEDIGNNETRTVNNTCTETIGNNWKVNVGGNIDIEAGGTITLKAPKIDLNP